MEVEVIIAILLNLVLGFLSYYKKAVTLDGFLTGFSIGLFIYIFGGLPFWLILVAFFVSSSLLSKYKKSIKEKTNDLHKKNDRRDYTQVLANSFVSCFCIFLYYIYSNEIFALLFLVSFAASNADTWASELGVLSKKNPVLITSFKTVSPGMSGGVSFQGTFFSFLGAVFIGAMFFLINKYFNILKDGSTQTFLYIVAGGFLGSMIDSLLGATIQAQYKCQVTGKLTEKNFSHGMKTKHVKGIKIINNDMVNFLSISGSVVTVFFINIFTK